MSLQVPLISISTARTTPRIPVTMDIIQHCLSLAPVPYLSPAFAVFKILCKSIQGVKGSREQLRVLASCISQLLYALDTEFRAHGQVASSAAKSLQDLSGCVGLCNVINHSSMLTGKFRLAVYSKKSTCLSRNSRLVTFSRPSSRRTSGSCRSQVITGKSSRSLPHSKYTHLACSKIAIISDRIS